MYLVHYNDKKEKSRSHEVALNFEGTEPKIYNSKLQDYYSINPFDNVGYGATKEEAYEDFKKKFFLSLNRLNEWGTELESNIAYKAIEERSPFEF